MLENIPAPATGEKGGRIRHRKRNVPVPPLADRRVGSV